MAGEASKLLASLPRRTARWLREADPSTPYSRVPDAAAFASELLDCAEAVERHRLDDQRREELLRMFAPTSEWDDLMGDPELDGAIFAALESLR